MSWRCAQNLGALSGNAILRNLAKGKHMLLESKVAVITGGGRGIGRAIALKFAAEGAAIVVAARTKSEIDSVAKEVRDTGGRAAAVTADVADEKQCEHLIHAATAEFGRVDILVNNAGEYGPVKPVEEIAPAEWDRVIAVEPTCSRAWCFPR